jgi:alginate O-acetyltransferase complex protein AlgI
VTLLSLPFLGLCLATLLLFYVLPSRAQILVLLAASVYFAWAWSWQALATLAFVVLANYFLALGLPRHPRLLGWGVVLNVAVWISLRQSDFFTLQFLELLARAGVQDTGPVPSLLPPVGLSFYVLSAISYLVDVRQGVLPPTRDLPAFGLFLGYFPKLLSGPIERARTFLPQLAQRRVVDNQVLTRSLARIVLGLTRKVVFADTLRLMIPQEVWTAPGPFPSPMLALWLLAAVVSIYNDFAGYTDIARGVSGLFGIELSPNFATPLFSRSFSELWTRWHISLSQWLRDYVYLPLSRALLRRTSRPNHTLNLWIPPMVTMLASAVWHGGGASLLVWGAVNGVYLAVERIVALQRPTLPLDRLPRHSQVLRSLVVLSLTLLGIAPFLMPLPGTFAFLRALFSMDPIGPLDLRVLVVLVASFLLDWWQYHTRQELPFLRWPRIAQAALLALVVLILVLVTRADTVSPFVYQEF